MTDGSSLAQIIKKITPRGVSGQLRWCKQQGHCRIKQAPIQYVYGITM